MKKTKNTKNEFIGREVGVIETYKVMDGDPVMKELKEVYPELRIWLPGMLGTTDYRLSRTNVHIVKDKKGVWRITKVSQG